MPLTPAVVLDAAITLLDEAGLEAFSTRKLAARLGVQVGALYWHYPSKRALLDAAADHIVGEAHAVAVPEGDWPEQAAAMIHALRDAMLAHADGARLVVEMGDPGADRVGLHRRGCADSSPGPEWTRRRPSGLRTC